MNAINVENISKKFSSFTLNDINLCLPKGTIMGMVGENGAGKTTLIKLIMNAIAADSGKITVLDCLNTSKDFTKTKQSIGIVLDESNFPEVLTPTNINKIMVNTYIDWNEQKYFSYLDRFSLPKKEKIKTFSRGTKMKLNISTALSHDPKLLILDEPTGGLDPMVRDEILTIFNEFTREEDHSVLFSSHIISDLEKICDYIAFLHQGKLILCEEKDLLLSKYALVKLSGEDFKDIPTDSIVRKKETCYGFEALLLKEKISNAISIEKISLEDIILFLSRGDL